MRSYDDGMPWAGLMNRSGCRPRRTEGPHYDGKPWCAAIGDRAFNEARLLYFNQVERARRVVEG